MTQKIIIDTDPGIDDAMAIFFALQSPELAVLGLTAVFGNGGVANTAGNAIRILETAGRGDIPVAVGVNDPLVIDNLSSGGTSVHSLDGLGNAGDQLPLTRHAAQTLVERSRLHKLLTGFRGAPPADRAALIDLILKLNRIIEHYGTFLETVELNPIAVLPQDDGVCVLDALIILRQAGQ